MSAWLAGSKLSLLPNMPARASCGSTPDYLLPRLTAGTLFPA